MPHPPEYYKKLRNNYHPNNKGIPVKYVFLCESPPYNGGYFYDKNNTSHQNLFRAMMWCISYQFEKLNTDTKNKGLMKFQESGCLLVDSIYEPVDNIKNDEKRDEKIKNNVGNLINDLNSIDRSNKFKIILVKANICRILPEYLNDFEILNKDVVVPFPSSGHSTCFETAIRLIKILNKIVTFIDYP